jgi:hypothetical protein
LGWTSDPIYPATPAAGTRNEIAILVHLYLLI